MKSILNDRYEGLEKWRSVLGYSGFYEVSNHGNIRSVDRTVYHYCGNGKRIFGVVLKQRTTPKGYKSVSLCKKGVKVTIFVHRVAANSWIKNNDNLKNQINHIDGIKTNNAIENLEWCTRSENMKHAYLTGLATPTKYWQGRFGKDHTKSIPVIQKDKNGNTIKKFDSSSSAARELNFNENSISRASKKARKTAYGFIWDREAM